MHSGSQIGASALWCIGFGLLGFSKALASGGLQTDTEDAMTRLMINFLLILTLSFGWATLAAAKRGGNSGRGSHNSGHGSHSDNHRHSGHDDDDHHRGGHYHGGLFFDASGRHHHGNNLFDHHHGDGNTDHRHGRSHEHGRHGSGEIEIHHSGGHD
ncbi:MAG: hypothetical protein Tsb0017_25830 [Geothermobacteraceae bacterium]